MDTVAGDRGEDDRWLLLGLLWLLWVLDDSSRRRKASERRLDDDFASFEVGLLLDGFMSLS